MAIDILTSTAKKYFENVAFQGKQIDEVLFPMPDDSINTTVKIDTYTSAPFALRSITKGQPAKVRAYQAGDGYEFEPPLYKEKTAIDEQLHDSVVAGVEPNSPAGMHMQQAVRHIVDGPAGFMAAAKMTRAKAALDVYLTGVFRGMDESEVIKEIDFNRDASLTLALDFATVSHDDALRSMYDALAAQGCPRANLAVIMGSDWLSSWERDAGVVAKREATQASGWITKNLQPPLLQDAEGLYVIGRYSIDGTASPVWVLAYEPSWPYRTAPNATPAPFMPADQAVMFDVGGVGYRCNRGVSVKNGDRIEHVVGDLVIDSFTDNDPPAEWVRANARFMYLRGNINHTCAATATNLP